MRSKLFEERPNTVKTRMDKWVRIFPDSGNVYRLYDPMEEKELGRILFDQEDNWIYDGDILDVYEQEDLADFITGNHKEMDELIKSIKG
jgi:hypothetical protein